MLLLEATSGSGMGGLGTLIAMIVAAMTAPAVILFIIAAFQWKKRRSLAKKLLLAGFLYLLVAGGICGIMVG